MGGLLTIPLALASAVYVLTKKGILYSLKYSITYLCFQIKRRYQRKRFDLYDYCAVGQPDKNAFFVPQEEWNFDTPLDSSLDEKQADGAFIYGSNSKSEGLAVCVSRRKEGSVLCSVILRLANGITYVLPKKNITQQATSDDNTFGSSRLKLQCLIPMRKWRIYFNGILKENSADNEYDDTYKHVKFSFTWTASSEIFDFQSDFSDISLSHVIATSNSWISSASYLLKSLKKTFNCYDQPGMILGTVSIENSPEQEIYLWGSRRRFMGEDTGIDCNYDTEIYGSLKNGSLFYIGTVNTSGITDRFVFGYVMTPTGFIYPVDEFSENANLTGNGELSVSCLADKVWYDIEAKDIAQDGLCFRKEFGEKSYAKMIDLKMNGKEGKGFIFKRLAKHDCELKKFDGSLTTEDKEKRARIESTSILSLQFENQLCQKSQLTGGKGSSLGNLLILSQSAKVSNENAKFRVPRGLVVTTEAYNEFIKGELEELLGKFEKDVWTKSENDTLPLCEKMMEVVNSTELPKNIRKSIETNLKAMFGESFFEQKFAIRSSATGEDTEQMSAAGQMETYLGVKGIDEIFRSVKKCWASQFSFQAVKYKRTYGQHLNTPMAVVIQEMVNCEVAGVMFTCDPVTGNPSFMSITANWGLGESVVSASADPDTILLRRTKDGQLCIHSKLFGNKKTKIVMGVAGTEEIETSENESSSSCIDEATALKLGQIAVIVEDYYGSSRDIEWGIAEGNIFLFQSRPVTSLDTETDFETKHFFDTFLRAENEYLTKANVGEVMPGAQSPLGIDILSKMFDPVNPRQFIKHSRGSVPHKPYYQKGLITAFNHTFLILMGGALRFDQEERTNALIVALYGQLLDKSGMQAASAERFTTQISKTKALIMGVYFFYLCFFAGKNAKRRVKKIENIQVPQTASSSSAMLQQIGEHYDIVIEAMSIHITCTVSSLFWNMSMLLFLSKARGAWDNDVFSDFAFLMSTCTDVESAEVPTAIQDLGAAISEQMNVEVFRKMSAEEALNWLTNDSSEAGVKFKQFLDRHGHRCLKEFDVYTTTWKSDPRSVIKMLQSFVSENTKRARKKETESFESIISKLHVKLNLKDRLYLRYWLLPNARRAVGEREYSKSISILMIDKLRKPCHRLAELMVEEGRLPRKELLFFLCIEEIKQLLRTRSPRLVTKAVRRWKVHEALDSLIFPQLTSGIPKPIKDAESINVSEKGFKMTGVPVSQGIVKGTARVVLHLKDAAAIQPGDILITYSTDIGWSPYFPLLSGVVTEIGGLISHGAVVAREYGLPCAVSVFGATRAFKSGDLVILDGNAGTLQKVENE